MDIETYEHCRNSYLQAIEQYKSGKMDTHTYLTIQDRYLEVNETFRKESAAETAWQKFRRENNMSDMVRGVFLRDTMPTFRPFARVHPNFELCKHIAKMMRRKKGPFRRFHSHATLVLSHYGCKPKKGKFIHRTNAL